MKIIFFGPPGAGKGTQAEIISNSLNIPTISTGAIIREAIKTGTKMGLEAKSYIESGALVPDSTIIGIVKDRLAEADCKNGFILDGFPRTIPQAEALDAMGVAIDVVLSLELSDDKIVERLGGRRLCAACGATYHLLFNPSKD
ncbi:MAG: nucleoside monophosphate kinase, partial [Clostridia bacterium]